MRARLPLILSAAALAVAILGSTPLGQAAGDAITKIPPFAKKANYANRAGTADNAKRLGGRTPAAYARLDANGKLPLSLLAGTSQGTAGAKGEKGEKGEKGDKGDEGDRGPGGIVAAYTKSAGVGGSSQALGTGATKLVSLSLPAGRYLILAQVSVGRDINANPAQLFAGCRLTAEKGTPDEDTAGAVVAGAKASAATISIASTQLVHEFSKTGTAELNCNDTPWGESRWSDARITAVQVASTKKLPDATKAGAGNAGNASGG